MVQIIVVDGRVGRDPRGPREELHRFESERPCNEGERLTLPDGSEVAVIGAEESVGETWTQTVFVGNVWDV